MARSIRIEFEDAVYHVTARGNERRRIYHSDAERALFLRTLEECVGLYHLKLHAYCLMPNHYHLILETPGANLSRAMAWLQTTFTLRLNRRRRRSGHLFQGRFKAHLVEADTYARTLLRYVHLNPVRPRDKRAPIKVERWTELKSFRWSSHRAFGGLQAPPSWLALDWLLLFGEEPHAASREYSKFVRAAFGEVLESPWEALRGGLVLGTETLWQKAREMIGARAGREEVRWTKGEEDVVARREASLRLAEGEDDRRLKIWLRVVCGGERRIDVARELGFADGSGVTQLLKRLEKGAAVDSSTRSKLDGYQRAMVSSVKR